MSTALNLNADVRKKIKAYFIHHEKNYYESENLKVFLKFIVMFLEVYKESFDSLPFPLQMQINLADNNQLIGKVSLFNMGSPYFVYSFFKYFLKFHFL